MVSLFGIDLGTVGFVLVTALIGAVALALVRAVAESDARNTGSSLRSGLTTIASGLATLFVVTLALSLAVSGPIFAGIFGSIETGVAWAALIAAVAFVGYYTDQVSFGFVLTGSAILLLLTDIAPTWMSRPFGFISQALFGVQFAKSIDPLSFAVLAFTSVVLFYALTIRLFGRAKKPSKVANRTRKQLESLVGEYISIGRVIGVFFLGIAFMVLQEGGEVATVATQFLGEAPLVASNLFAGVLGYFGFGGGIPKGLRWIPGLTAVAEFFSNLGPVSYLFIVVFVAALGFGAAQRLDYLDDRLSKEREKRREAQEDAKEAKNRRERAIQLFRGD